MNTQTYDTARLLNGAFASERRSELHGDRSMLAWFYVGLPLLIAFALAWMRVGKVAVWPVALCILYWFGSQLIVSSVSTLATRPIAGHLRKRGAPLWLTLLAGHLLATVAVIPALQILQCAMNDMTLAANHPVAPIPLDINSVAAMVPVTLSYWLLMNLLFVDVVGLQRFGYARSTLPPRQHQASTIATDTTPAADSELPETFDVHDERPAGTRALPPQASAASTSEVPAFIQRMRPERRGSLLALRAEGHYLRIHTDNGSDLITYRLSDALSEIPGEDGMQVHRSWWVAARALAADRHPAHLALVNGLEVPVSRSYLTAARQREWLTTP